MATNSHRAVYVCQTFPGVTQAFTVREVGALVEGGIDVRVLSFRRPPAELIGPAGRALLARVTFLPPPRSALLLAAFLRVLVRHPGVLLEETVAALSARGLLHTTSAMRERELLAVVRGAWIAERCPDAGLFHAEFPDEAATAAMVAARLTGRPFSFKSHASFNPMQLERKARNAAFVATESAFSRNEYFAALPGEHVLVNYGGVVPTAAVVRRPSTEELRILCVGTLQEKKGQIYLVRALRLLRDRGVRFRCLFVGSGPLEARLPALVAASGLEEHVEFRSYLPHEDLGALYAQHDVVVLPAVVAANGDRDGLPAVLIEAGDAGCALVSTPVSGIPELIEDGRSGLLVSERDELALADALERLAVEPGLCAALATGAREVVRDRFDLRRNVAELADRFRAILGVPPGGPRSGDDDSSRREPLPSLGERIPTARGGIRSGDRARSSAG